MDACEMQNNNKFTFENVCFMHEHNENSGLYRQQYIVIGTFLDVKNA